LFTDRVHFNTSKQPTGCNENKGKGEILMKKLIGMMVFGAMFAALMLPAAAQTTTSAPPQSTTTTAAPPSTTQPAPPSNTGSKQPESGQRVNQRTNNQQERISNGIKDGQLTPGEASQLENQEKAINQEKNQMRSQDDGHLTAADRAKLGQQQNQLSNQIHSDAHNGNTQKPLGGEVGNRAENQQNRIAGGLQNHTLDASQAGQLENEEHNINKQVAQDRAANGGHLTQSEKQQINREQNHVSNQIHSDRSTGKKNGKHNSK
jgi:hypothetical protein